MERFKQMRVLIIGLGISGISAARFMLEKQAQVWAIDRNHHKIAFHPAVIELREQGLLYIKEEDLPPLKTFSQIIVSPGVPHTHSLLVEAARLQIEVLGEIELAFRYLKHKVIGITGTNGKTTVTSLLTHILNASGQPAKALGNIGEPLIAEIDSDPNTVLVVELSSFQIETIHTPCIDLGVILNITPDHLDRYSSMETYALAKMRMHTCLKPGGALYMEEKAYRTFGHLESKLSPKLYGYSEECDLYTDLNHIRIKKTIDCILPLQYRGSKSHILENFLATYSLCKEMGIDAEQFWEGVSSFKIPPHRIEKVRTHDGISYYNDSKGTNIDAVMRAVETLNGPVILIAGGVDKGTDFSPWLDAFAEKVKCICAIGQATDKIENTLSMKFKVYRCESLPEAVEHASSLAQPGDNVLLSPGCASFDMFENYAHRGIVFKDSVNALQSFQNT